MLDMSTKFIAVCCAGVDEDYNDVILPKLREYGEEMGYKMLYFYSFSTLFYGQKHDIGEGNIFHLINFNLIDGIIMLSESIRNDKIRDEIVKRAACYDIPVVSIDHYIEGCYNINFQYEGAMRKILKHMLDTHGYRRINFIAGPKGNSYSEERLKVYKDVLEEYGIEIEPERIGYGDFWGEPTVKVLDEFMECGLPLPEAIVCANDTMAIATIRYFSQKGYQVPKQIAVTGFDGIREALEHPLGVTTARHNYREAAKKAVETLGMIFSGGNPEKKIFIESEVIFGESCGCAVNTKWRYSALTRELYERIESNRYFANEQIVMTADLTDSDSFYDVFDKITNYAEYFSVNTFWLCIVDDFLSEKEALSDIIEESSLRRMAYSDVMAVMLSKYKGEWQGLTDFHTIALLPNMEKVFSEYNNVIFFPLHVQEQTIGYVAMSYEPERMDIGRIYQFLMNISNALEVTKIHRRQQTIINNLEIKYVHDPMTGLFNRRGFYQKTDSMYKTAIDEQKTILVASVDLNGLKQINDTYGHSDGDIAISTVGKALAYVGMKDCVCARFGGDEFVAAGLAESEEDAQTFHREMEEYLEKFNRGSGLPYTVSASIGIVTGVPNREISLEEFIKAADEKMYQEKVEYHQKHNGQMR